MSQKEYNSLEYFVQEFVKFLRKKPLRAEYHGTIAQFSVLEKEYSLEFSRNGKTTFVRLEKRVNGNYEYVKEIDIEPKRSKSGRISGNYFSGVLKNLFS